MRNELSFYLRRHSVFAGALFPQCPISPAAFLDGAYILAAGQPLQPQRRHGRIQAGGNGVEINIPARERGGGVL